ncbi:MAG: GAP family protein [Ilumatobacteraceae bacterium]
MTRTATTSRRCATSQGADPPSTIPGSLFAVLALIVPLGLAAAVSPVMLAEQTVLLAGPNGRVVANRFAIGVGLVALVYVGVLVLWGRVVALPAKPKLSSTMDLVFGVLLVAFAAILWVRRPASSVAAEAPRRSVSPGEAVGFGAFSMATNFTTLALLLPGAKVIASSHVDIAGRLVLVAVLVVLASTPAWLPVALTRVSPGAATRGLDALGRLITRHGRTVVVVVVGALGVYLIVHGLIRLAER